MVCYLADVGQEDAKDAAAIEKKALLLGAERMVIVDLQKVFVEELVFRAIQCNAIFEDRCDCFLEIKYCSLRIN